MIRLIAQGGLGNQLFVWNYAHELHLYHKTEVIITFSRNHDNNRAIFLEDISNYCPHGIKIKYSSRYGFLLRHLDMARSRIPSIVNHILRASSIVLLESADATLDELIRPKMILRGYFQDSKSVLKNFQTYSLELDSWLEDFVSLSTKDLVHRHGKFNAIHMRRGDFEASKLTTGILTNEYFAKLVDPDFSTIILTDDLRALPGIIDSFPEALVLSPSEVSPQDAIYILSKAYKLITSNSTFSWWAAVIGSNTIEGITMPRPWNIVQFNGPGYLDLPFVNFAEAVFEE